MKPYHPIEDLAEARQAADVVAEGVVTATEEGEHYPLPGEYWDMEGHIGHRCLVEMKVTLRVSRALKNVQDSTGQIVFQYWGRCVHPEPGDMIEQTDRPVQRGDRLRTYLKKEGDKYWLIAHERLPQQ